MDVVRDLELLDSSDEDNFIPIPPLEPILF
jgi:hypothetical protein